MAVATLIQGVTARKVNRKKDGAEITIYEIMTSDNTKWTTSRRDLAGEANRLIGQPVLIEGRTEVNGIYENYYLEDVRPNDGTSFDASDSFPIPGTIQQQMTPPAHLAPPTPPPAPIPVAPPPPPPIPAAGPAERDWQIWRQCATKVAVHLSQTPAEFWANVDDLIRYYAYGAKPQIQNGTAPRQPEPFITTDMTAAINADPHLDLDNPGFDDSDIPFLWVDQYGREPRQALRWHRA